MTCTAFWYHGISSIFGAAGKDLHDTLEDTTLQLARSTGTTYPIFPDLYQTKDNLEIPAYKIFTTLSSK